jgi:hypothetical protein
MFQCHCRDCQRATGGLFAPNVRFEASSVEITGEPKTYEVESDAGNVVHHEFCEECGSPIGMRTSNNPGARGLRAATFDDFNWLEPAANIYMRNSPRWELIDPKLAAVDGQPSQEFIASIIARANT